MSNPGWQQQNEFANSFQHPVRIEDPRRSSSAQPRLDHIANQAQSNVSSRLMESGIGQNRLRDHSLHQESKQLSPERNKKIVVNPNRNGNSYNNVSGYQNSINQDRHNPSAWPNQPATTYPPRENRFFGNNHAQQVSYNQQTSYANRTGSYDPSPNPYGNPYPVTNGGDHVGIRIGVPYINSTERREDLTPAVPEDNTPYSDRTQKKITGFKQFKQNIERKLSFTSFFSKKPTGLKNFGNTCYMNSIIQCLAFCSDLGKYFEALFRKEFEPHKISHFLGQLICTLKSESSKDLYHLEYQLRNLKGSLGQVNPDLNSSNQQDALEFFKTLLEQVNNDESRIVSKPLYRQLSISLRGHRTVQTLSEEWHNHMKERENSIVTDLFCGQLLNMIVCAQCRHEEISFEPYWDLSLSFNRKNFGPSTYNLYDMLREAFLADHVEYDLKECRCHNKMKTRISKIWRLPKILVIHFKRFKITEDGYDKIYAPVEYPEHLNLNEMVQDLRQLRFYNQDFALGRLDKSLENTTYNLFGVVNHVGNLDRGHYTAECKDQQSGTWYELNDDVVTKISGPGRWNDSAYMLFYVKDGEGI